MITVVVAALVMMHVFNPAINLLTCYSYTKAKQLWLKRPNDLDTQFTGKWIWIVIKELIAKFLLGEKESFPLALFFSSFSQSFSKSVNDYEGIKGHGVVWPLGHIVL